MSWVKFKESMKLGEMSLADVVMLEAAGWVVEAGTVVLPESSVDRRLWLW